MAAFPTAAGETSRYMGDEVELVTAPNGARVNAGILEVSLMIIYPESTTDKVADGVWCIGGSPWRIQR